MQVGSTEPYRGAFAQISEWRQQSGWSSIVEAHSSVAVRCKSLYMQDAEEFVTKHCFFNIESNLDAGTRVTTYPTPRWSIVEDCCENLERPVLRVHDAVWATTRGVAAAPHRRAALTHRSASLRAHASSIPSPLLTRHPY